MASSLLGLNELREIERRMPELTERVVRLIESESIHRENKEQLELREKIAARRRAQWMGVAISLIALAAGTATALAGVHPAVPIAMMGIPILASARAICWPVPKTDY